MTEFPATPPLSLAKVEPILLRAKIDTPIITSFGTIPERAVLLVRLEDKDGAVGWGEIFGNFPMHGAENRAHLVRDYIAPIALSEEWESPAHAFEAMTRKTHIMTLQSGEPGSFAQAIAGVDIALWDLAARRAGKPLWQLLGGKRGRVPTYASGLNPKGFGGIVERKLDEGYNAFKIKIGFGREVDFAALTKMREMIGEGALMTDVNQGWDVETACENWATYSEFNLGWIEEPLPADRPLDEWRQIAALGGSPVAAGENLLGDAQFGEHIDAKVFDVVQPDMCKWGGFTKTLPLARRIVAAGQTYCPHFLAGPIGVMSAAHCLAAAGGDGVLEIDANGNPIRERLTGGLPPIDNGILTLPGGPGLGIEPDAAALHEFATH
ncbi:MAG: mandelate racemase/muconate lactonizing enzyme family protein [Alphaproteobacteria bacterium]